MNDFNPVAPTHKCSFCDRDNHQVKHMIAGPGVSICDKCVLLCVEIVFSGGKQNEVNNEPGV